MTRCSSLIVLVVAFAGLLASGIIAHSEPPKSIRVGYSISLTGPNAAGAGITVLPNYRLWVKEVNAAGGILLKSVGKRVPIEVIEYDDHSNVIDAETAIERLISQAREALAPGGGLVFEISGTIADRVRHLLSSWDEVAIRNDLQGIARVAIARKATSG